ncbi:uncharacterized protein LOC119406863 [Rhipicephalus sanguineus]|uniref:uncharacterized protein LOC119406863 n=1 Tax=Rhipicephalus sanguineus TaxID=34632 RepID=UPI00189508BF|nr:uncharacterized protein LOC119406863 [Rhipicephalus sanguineus]
MRARRLCSGYTKYSMNFLPAAFFAATVLLQKVDGNTTQTCNAGDHITSHFMHYPDAEKLINHSRVLYCLVYHSKDGKKIRDEMPCLCARVSFSGGKGGSLTFLYQFSYNKTHIATGLSIAEMNRTDQAFKQYNEIIFSYVIEQKLYKETTRILYTDYHTCAVLNSTLLGTMLWVRHDLLINEAPMPYLCTVTYELAARDVRYIVYDWKECPTRMSYNKNAVKPKRTNKNNAKKDL